MRNDPVEEIQEDEVTITIEKKSTPITSKKKMGRPKKAKEDLKSKQVPSYFTEKEHQAIDDVIAFMKKEIWIDLYGKPYDNFENVNDIFTTSGGTVRPHIVSQSIENLK